MRPSNAIAFGVKGSKYTVVDTPSILTCRGILAPRVQPALMMCLSVGFASKQIISFIDHQRRLDGVDEAVQLGRLGHLDILTNTEEVARPRTATSMLLPESGSGLVAARSGECVGTLWS